MGEPMEPKVSIDVGKDYIYNEEILPNEVTEGEETDMLKRFNEHVQLQDVITVTNNLTISGLFLASTKKEELVVLPIRFIESKFTRRSEPKRGGKKTRRRRRKTRRRNYKKRYSRK